MGSLSSLAFSVRRREPELVAPAKPTPRELKPLSDIDDQEGLRFHFPVIMFYRSEPSMEGKDPVKVIREALAAALVFYYPLAGRLVEGPNRKLLVDCTAEGVLFIEADADVTLEQLGDAILPPCPNLEELLYNVPGSDGILGCPLLLIQVTRLICGGFILAIRLNHTMCDGLGLAQFLNAVGEMAQGAHSPSLLPTWQRELLDARQPPHVTCMHYEYEKVVETKSMPMNIEDGNMVQRSFFFGPKEMRALRKQLPPHLRLSSTFEVLTACLWRCRIIALELHPDEVVRISCLVNVRGKHLVDLPPGYYGNAFAFPAEVSTAKLLSQSSLAYAMERVKTAKDQMTQEYIRSVADLMVIKGRPKYITTWNYIVSDITRIGLGKVNLGWGKPIYGGAARAVSIISFYARFKNIKGEEGIVVPICLPQPFMETFQEELKKITHDSSEDSSIIPDTIVSRL